MRPRGNNLASGVSPLLLLAMLLAGAMPAAADTISFTNQADFASQTGSTLLTVPNVASASSVTIPGQLTIAAASVGTLISGSSVQAVYFNLATNFVAKSGTENFNITPLTTVYAFGFTLYEPTSSALLNGCNTTCVESTFTITLFSGSTNIGSLTVQPPDNQFNFYGFWSSDPITSVQIRETTGTNDNEFFGQFYTGTTPYSNTQPPGPPPARLPEPSSLLLVACGLAGIGLRKRLS